MVTRIPNYQPLLVDRSSDGVGQRQLIADYRHVMIDLATSGNANMTIRVLGSLMKPEEPVNFAVAPDIDNRWDYQEFYVLRDSSSAVAGITGIVTGGVDIVRNILVNIDGLVWVTMEVSNYVAGTVRANLVCYRNT